MTENTEKAPSRFKTSLVAILIVAASSAIAYNAMFLQDVSQKRPGSTALRVEVRDTDVEEAGRRENLSSIGQLVKNTQTPRLSAAQRKMVAQIQRDLTALGFYRGEIDGKPGPKTSQAIRQYQNRNGLRATGEISPRLSEHIGFTRKIARASANTGSVTAPRRHAYSVAAVQQKLQLFGYDPGSVDGKMGAATVSALKRFQSDRSLPATGRITSTVLTELGLQ